MGLCSRSDWVSNVYHQHLDPYYICTFSNDSIFSRRSKVSSCRAAIRAAKGIVSDLGEDVAAKSRGLTELSRCHETTSERDVERLTRKFNLSLRIPITELREKIPWSAVHRDIPCDRFAGLDSIYSQPWLMACASWPPQRFRWQKRKGNSSWVLETLSGLAPSAAINCLTPFRSMLSMRVDSFQFWCMETRGEGERNLHFSSHPSIQF